MLPTLSQLMLAKEGGGLPPRQLVAYFWYLPKIRYPYFFNWHTKNSKIPLCLSMRHDKSKAWFPDSILIQIRIQVKLLPVAAILNSLNLKSDLSRTSGKAENLGNATSSLVESCSCVFWLDNTRRTFMRWDLRVYRFVMYMSCTIRWAPRMSLIVST